MRMTQQKVDEHEARMAAARGNTTLPSKPINREAELHKQIKDFCAQQFPQWVCLHGSTAHKTHRTIGEPDFVVAAQRKISQPLYDQFGQIHGYATRTEPLVVFVECKRPGGKLSPEQQGMRLMLEKLGHKLHVVESMDEFLEVVK